MSVVNKIKSTLERKAVLAGNIAQCERWLHHCQTTSRIALHTKGGDHIYLDVSHDLIAEALKKQIETDKSELAVIDKQIEAIAVLMGCN